MNKHDEVVRAADFFGFQIDDIRPHKDYGCYDVIVSRGTKVLAFHACHDVMFMAHQTSGVGNVEIRCQQGTVMEYMADKYEIMAKG